MDALIENFLAKVSDPLQFGPILWYNIHLLSKGAKTLAECKQFYDVILKRILEGIRCDECRKDALLYHGSHPLIWKHENSAFDWTYDFHTYVNYKLGKPNIDRNTYYHLYSGNLPTCTKCTMPKSDSSKTVNEPAEVSIPKGVSRIKGVGLRSYNN